MSESELLTKGAPPQLIRLLRGIESDSRLDPVIDGLSCATTGLDEERARFLLSGAWLGHALHPLLTDLPLGSWASATLLDLFGGRRSRPAAQGLVVFGLACTVPTVASGLYEWRHTARRDQRVGVVHAVLNGLATVCYASSIPRRARGQRFRTAGWSVAGGLAAVASGYLGGHLTIARKIGSRDVELAGVDDHENRGWEGVGAG